MRFRRALPLAGWIASLLVGLVVFHGLGQGPMAAPSLTDPTGWSAWLQARDPAVATAALLRLVVLALSWYLVGVTTIGLAARLLRATRLVRLADALTVPMVRRLLQSALGVGLATTMVGATTVPTDGHVEAARPESGVTMVLAGTEEAAPTATGEAAADPGGADAGPMAMRLLEQDQALDEVRMRRASEGGQVTMRAAEGKAGEPGEVSEGGEGGEAVRAPHLVMAGESLWSIAQDALADRLGRQPTDDEVLDYWRRVVDHNRPYLADPDNPDLLFPGDEVHLPTTVGGA